MEKFLIDLLFIILGMIIGLTIYLSWRNLKVHDLLISVNHACYNYEKAFLDACLNDTQLTARWKEWEEIQCTTKRIRSRNSYERMLFSFHPLTLQEWYTPDEKDILEKYRDQL